MYVVLGNTAYLRYLIVGSSAEATNTGVTAFIPHTSAFFINL